MRTHKSIRFTGFATTRTGSMLVGMVPNRSNQPRYRHEVCLESPRLESCPTWLDTDLGAATRLITAMRGA